MVLVVGDPVTSPWEAAARMFEPPAPAARRWASPLDLACALDPSIVRTPALELINAALVELVDTGLTRLLVAMPPQEGKSVLCSKWFPLWCLTTDADLRVAVVSYSDEMARRWGSEIKLLVESFDGTEETADLGIRLRGDSRAAGRWQVHEHIGGVYCVGIAGSLTGKPVDCLVGETQILTEHGYVSIREICGHENPPRVLSFNHHTSTTEWRTVVATRTITNRPLIEVTTAAGRHIICTPDHRIHTTDRGYVPAAELPHGARLITAGQRSGQAPTHNDTVHMVRKLCGIRDTVYDLQVDGNSNFFADEILVHNCLIIDDPIKDLAAAQSEAYRRRCQDFWQGVAVPRLGPGAKCLLIQTRWHESDMAGWLLASEGEGDQDKGGKWKVVSIPAQAESNHDPLGRTPGEYLTSARGDRDWEATKASVGPYVWAALYQQHPAPAEGGLFKRLWWRYWHPAPEQFGERIDCGGRIWPLKQCWRFATADLAASTRTTADWTVFIAWAITLDGDLVILDMAREQVAEGGHYGLVRPLVERWGLDTVFVEKSQYGTTLARDAARAGVPLSPLIADVDKLTRALPASAKAAAGRIWLPAGAPWLQHLLDETASFPNGSHDDICDCIAYAARVSVTEWVPPPPRPVDPQHREIDFMSVPM